MRIREANRVVGIRCLAFCGLVFAVGHLWPLGGPEVSHIYSLMVNTWLNPEKFLHGVPSLVTSSASKQLSRNNSVDILRNEVYLNDLLQSFIRQIRWWPFRASFPATSIFELDYIQRYLPKYDTSGRCCGSLKTCRTRRPELCISREPSGLHSIFGWNRIGIVCGIHRPSFLNAREPTRPGF